MPPHRMRRISGFFNSRQKSKLQEKRNPDWEHPDRVIHLFQSILLTIFPVIYGGAPGVFIVFV